MAEAALIRPLAREVVGHLRSTVAITSLSMAVEELVCNSLDAGATAIDVSVQPEGGFVDVRDDGRGIDEADLAVVGARHATSKIRSLDDLASASTLGYRGEALASLGEVGVLSIHSAPAGGGGRAFEKWIKGGDTLSLGASPRRRSQGTTVTVRDLFYNFPVRQKAARADGRKELQRIRQQLTRLALANCAVSFSLYDSQRSCTVLQTRSVPDACVCFAHLFGQTQAGKLARLEPEPAVEGAAAALRLEGFLSRPGCGYHTRELQFLFVNRRFVTNTCGAQLHQRINRRMKALCLPPSQVMQLRAALLEQATADSEAPGGRGVAAIQTTEAVRAFPLFVLNLVAPPTLYDVTYEVSKTTIAFRDEEAVAALVDAALERFLEAHGVGKDAAPSAAGGASADAPEPGAQPRRTLGLMRPVQSDRRRVRATLSTREASASPPAGERTVCGTDAAPPSAAAAPKEPKLDILPEAMLLQSHAAAAVGAPQRQPAARSAPAAAPAPLARRIQDGRPSNRARSSRVPRCACSLDAVAREVSKMNSNHGRRFYCCPKPRAQSCGFFAWADDDKTAAHDGDVGTESSGSAASGSLVTRSAGPPLQACRTAAGADDGSRERRLDEDAAQPASRGVEASGAQESAREPAGAGGARSDPAETTAAAAALPLAARQQSRDPARSPGHAYSVTQVLNSWENPCLKRQSTRQPRQGAAGGDEQHLASHIPIASFDLAPPSKRRRRTAAGPGEGRSRAVADVQLSRPSLRQLRVCGQFDLKAILCTLDDSSVANGAGRLLVAVDQHAADERVQLERLQREVYGEAGDQRHFETVRSDAVWAFDPHEVPLLQEHRDTLRRWGFSYASTAADDPPGRQRSARDLALALCKKASAGQRDSGRQRDSATLVEMRSVPRVAGVTLSQLHLRKFLQQLGATAGGPSAAATFKPTAVAEVLAYRACHSAVRFGDQLSTEDCRRIVSQLAACRLPFQCAHGRPTLHPMLFL